MLTECRIGNRRNGNYILPREEMEMLAFILKWEWDGNWDIFMEIGGNEIEKSFPHITTMAL